VSGSASECTHFVTFWSADYFTSPNFLGLSKAVRWNQSKWSLLRLVH